MLDGIRLLGGEEVLVPDVWSYNQGTVLGALVTLGDDQSLARAAALVAAVDARLTTEVGGARVLRTHGGGDGGLFTGILVRYLALAANVPALDPEARETARRLVTGTADALWTRSRQPAGSRVGVTRRSSPSSRAGPHRCHRSSCRRSCRPGPSSRPPPRSADPVGKVSDRARRLGAGWESRLPRVRLETCAPHEPSPPASPPRVLLGACSTVGPTDDRGGGTTGAGPTAYASASSAPSPAPSTTAPEQTPTPGPTSTPKPAPDPASIAALIAMQYDGGNLRLGRERGSTDAYRQYFATYESNGLTISGRINIPRGTGPFPAVVLAHGYVDPAVYTNGETMLRERDHLARQGYVTLHIDYRNHAQSDKDPRNDANLRAGYTVDAINAGLALKKAQVVDPDRIALIGRSMGGGVVYTALVVRPGLFRAAVAYAPVSSDTVDNFDKWVRRDASRSGAARAVIGRLGTPEAQPGGLGGDEPAHLLRPHHRAAPHPPRHRRRGLPAVVVARVRRGAQGRGQGRRAGDLSRRAAHADVPAVGHLDPPHRGLPRRAPGLTSGAAATATWWADPADGRRCARARHASSRRRGRDGRARRPGGRRGRGCSGSPSRARPGRASPPRRST